MSWAEVKKINSNFRASIDEILYSNIFYPLIGTGTDGEFNSIGDVTGNIVDNIVMYECSNFTLNQGHTLKPIVRNKGILIRCMGTCTINGTIDQRNNSMGANFNKGGAPWVANTSIDLPPKYYLPLSGLDAMIKNRFVLTIASGGAGGNGGLGAKFDNTYGGVGSEPGTGGIGGTSTSLAFGGNAGAGGGGGGGGGLTNINTYPPGGYGGLGVNASMGVAGTGGVGGVSAQNVAYKGGTGGNGGLGAGNLIIIASNIIIGNTASILAYGTNGTNGTNGDIDCGGGGGGGGGNGGSIAFFYTNSYSNLGTINNAGGTGGDGGSKGNITNVNMRGSTDGAKGTNGGNGTLSEQKF